MEEKEIKNLVFVDEILLDIANSLRVIAGRTNRNFTVGEGRLE